MVNGALKMLRKKYFGKSASELTVPEAAMIAGLLQAPSAYDPYKHLERATERRNVVLKTMLENKKN